MPSLQNWYNSLKLQPIHNVKHDLYSGWVVAHICRAVFGERFELRTFTQDTSESNARHNWERILQIKNLLKLPLQLQQSNIEKIVKDEDEKELLNVLINLYELSTNTTYQKAAFRVPQILTKKADSSAPTAVTQNIKLQSQQSSPAIQTQIIASYPVGVPQFCRSQYINSRRLIDHLSQICKDSITSIDKIKEYIEMLDPRADLCFPFPQLLLRLPSAEYCLQVCKYLCENIDLELITKSISEDYVLFYDFSSVMLHSVVALNQVSGTATSLFDIVTDQICTVLLKIRSQSEDQTYLIYHNLILAKLFCEIPIVNFSLVHFFKICFTCISSCTQVLFNQLLNYALSNMKQTQKNVSENRLRFEILIAMTILAQQTGKYKEQIASSAVRYTLHAELLKDSEKFVALDLMCRCVVLHTPLYKDVEFQMFRHLNVILNKIQLEENAMLDFVDQVLIKASNGMEVEFIYDRVSQLNFEQVLFLEILLMKLEAVIQSSNLTQVNIGLESRLINDEELPPCHFYIGIAAILRRKYSQIEQISNKLLEAVKTPKFDTREVINLVNQLLETEPQIKQLLQSVSKFALRHENYLNSLLSLFNGELKQTNIISKFIDQNGINREGYISLKQELIQLGINAAIAAKQAELDKAIAETPEQKINEGNEKQENELVPQEETNVPLPAHIFKNIGLLGQQQKIQVIAPLLIFYIAAGKKEGTEHSQESSQQGADQQAISQQEQQIQKMHEEQMEESSQYQVQWPLTRESAQLLFSMLVINSGLAPFVYSFLNEQLFSSLLNENNKFSDAIVDLVKIVLIQMNNMHHLEENQDDVRTSLQAILDFCFGYGQRNQGTLEQKVAMQEKCMKLFNQLKLENCIKVILVDMFEKMDYETYGNDFLEKLINEIAGDV